MYGQVLSWRWIGPIQLAQCWLQAFQFLCISSICWACFSDVMVSLHQDSESCSISDGQQTTKRVIMTFFWCKFGFGKCFGVSSWSNHWAGHYRLSYKIHFLSHVTIQSINGLLHTIREDDTSKQWFFFFFVSSWGTHLSSFSTFPICFKCQMTIEGLTLSSWATSGVVVKRFNIDDLLSWLLSFNFQCMYWD